MKLPRLLSILLVLLSLLLTACGGAATPEAPAYDVVLTQGVQTMVAAFFETQTAVAPTATSVPPTNTSTPAYTPTGFMSNLQTPSLTATLIWIPIVNTNTPIGTVVTGTVKPGDLAAGCNNLEVLGDASLSSDKVAPGDDFTVTWSVRNTGTCPWEFNYHLVQTSGPDFDMVGGYADRNIPPGNKGTVTAKLQAPGKHGTASGSFRMANGSGTLFGATLTFTIEVEG